MSVVLDRGGTDPDNYLWRATPARVLCFTREGELVLDVAMPRTLRHALLLGYLEGWAHGDSVHRDWIDRLEALAGDQLPKSWPAAS